MKIVIINAVYGIMSTGRSYTQLQQYLINHGHQCIVAYGNQKRNPSPAHTIYMGNLVDHKIHALSSRITGNAGCYSRSATRKLLAFFDRYHPDVVHLGNLHGNFIDIPMLLDYLADRDIATTVTLHDCYFFTGGCTHYTVNQCYKWETDCRNCPHVKSLNSWFFDRADRMLRYKIDKFNRIPRLGVIGVSDWLTQEAARSPVFAHARSVSRIYDWVDLERFCPTPNELKSRLGIAGKTMILGVASGWGASKGLPDFIRLAESLDDHYAVVLVGQMPEKERSQLPPHLISVPPTNSAEQLAEYYSAADVFLQLSLEETFGKVVAESLACGTPAVVYRSTASPELVEGGCGLSVDPADGIDGIRKALYELLKHDKKEYTNLCVQKSRNYFDMNVSCQQYLGLFENLLAR